MILGTILSPPVAFIVFLILVSLGYILIQGYAAKGLDHAEKHMPYSGGQKIPPMEVRLSYEAFFRIALLFSIAHVAVLVLATLPLMWISHQIGLLYLGGISISAIVLAHKKSR